MINPLLAISPVDGRYRSKTEDLSEYFSEYALFKYRIRVEIEYFIALSQIPLPELAEITHDDCTRLRSIYDNFSIGDAEEIKETEKTTNHDVKAVEYFLKDRFTELGLGKYAEFIHFALTSQDINNTAIPLALKEALHRVYIPELEKTVSVLDNLVVQWADVPMLSHTHGQPATPTRVGKEFEVFSARLKEQKRQLQEYEYPAKFGGAVGNMNAHCVAYPAIDWNTFAESFVSRLGLCRSYPTTQIDHYDNLAAIFDVLSRINVILVDLSRDVWSYISMEYFHQKIKAGEIGSSTMPHKVNPIDFENAEGNLTYACAIFRYLAEKLPISRLQRDLTDSTVLRNTGVPIAHSLIALKSLEKGLGKLILNAEKIEDDLENNWEIVAEGIQTILRREGFPKPYEALKDLTRTGERISRGTISRFIDSLSVSERVKEELRAIAPDNYTGI